MGVCPQVPQEQAAKMSRANSKPFGKSLDAILQSTLSDQPQRS
jgi:hypothetical protein